MSKQRNTLTNVEFLALKMQAHPGQSGRFYRRALCQYREPQHFGTVSPKAYEGYLKGDHFAAYFRAWVSYPYPGRLWVDKSTDRVGVTRFWEGRPKKSKWYLTPKGHEVANRARVKLGLPVTHNKDNHAIG